MGRMYTNRRTSSLGEEQVLEEKDRTKTMVLCKRAP